MALPTRLLSVCWLESSSRDEIKNKSDHATIFDIFSKSCSGLVTLSVNQGENAAICDLSRSELMFGGENGIGVLDLLAEDIFDAIAIAEAEENETIVRATFVQVMDGGSLIKDLLVQGSNPMPICNALPGTEVVDISDFSAVIRSLRNGISNKSRHGNGAVVFSFFFESRDKSNFSLDKNIVSSSISLVDVTSLDFDLKKIIQMIQTTEYGRIVHNAEHTESTQLLNVAMENSSSSPSSQGIQVDFSENSSGNFQSIAHPQVQYSEEQISELRLTSQMISYFNCLRKLVETKTSEKVNVCELSKPISLVQRLHLLLPDIDSLLNSLKDAESSYCVRETHDINTDYIIQIDDITHIDDIDDRMVTTDFSLSLLRKDFEVLTANPKDYSIKTFKSNEQHYEDHMHQMNESLQHSLLMASDDFQSLKEKLTMAEDTIHQLENSLKISHSHQGVEDIIEKDDCIASLEARVEELEIDLSESHDLVLSMEERVKENVMEITCLSQQLTTMNEEQTSLLSVINSEKFSALQREEHVEHEKQKFRDLENVLEDAMERFEALGKENFQLRIDREQSFIREADFCAALEGADDEIASLKEQISNLEHQLEEAADESNVLAALNTELKSSLDVKERDLYDTKICLATLAASEVFSRDTSIEQSKIIADLRRHRQEESTNHESQCAEAAAQARALLEAQESTKIEIKARDDRISTLQDNVNQQAKVISKLEDEVFRTIESERVVALQKSLLQAEFNNICIDLEAKGREIVELKNSQCHNFEMITKLTIDINKLREDYDSSVTSFETLTQENIILADQLNHATLALSDLTEEFQVAQVLKMEGPKIINEDNNSLISQVRSCGIALHSMLAERDVIYHDKCNLMQELSEAKQSFIQQAVLMDAIKQESVTYLDQLSSLNENLQENDAILTQTIVERDSLLQELAKANEIIQDLDENLRTTSQDREILSEDKVFAFQRLQEYETTINSFVNEKSTLLGDMEELRQQIQGYEKLVRNLNEEKDTFVQQVSALQLELLAKEAIIQELNCKSKAESGHNLFERNNTTDANSNNAELFEEMNELFEAKMEAEMKLSVTEKDLKALRDQLSEIDRTNLKEQQLLVSIAEKEMDTLRSQCKAQEQSVKEAQENAQLVTSQFEYQLMTSVNEKEECAAVLIKTKEDMQCFKDLCETQAHTLMTLENELTEMKSTLISKDQRIAHLEAYKLTKEQMLKVKQLKDERGCFMADNIKLKNEIAELYKRCDELKGALQTSSASGISEPIDEVQELQHQVSILTSKLQETVQKMQDTKDMLRRLSIELKDHENERAGILKILVKHGIDVETIGMSCADDSTTSHRSEDISIVIGVSLMAEKLSMSRSSSQIKKLEEKIIASKKFKEDAVKCIKDLKTAARSYKDKAYGLSVELESLRKEVSVASKRNGLTNQSTPVKLSQNETHDMCSPRRPISQGKENKNDYAVNETVTFAAQEVKKNVTYKGQKRNLELVNASPSCQVKKGMSNNVEVLPSAENKRHTRQRSIEAGLVKGDNIDYESTECPSFL